MRKSTIGLSFQCPKKWQSMSPANGGRFCADCNKVVKEFSGVSVTKPQALILASNEEEICGNFYSYQLEKPFGSWRDKIISFYQQVAFGLKANIISKKLALFILSVVLVVTGCARRTRGMIAVFDDHRYNKKENHKTTHTALPPMNNK